jgi:arylsulfatase A-like enzyme
VPLIVSWPGHVPAGRVSADLVDSSDFLPTFAALAGATPPANLVLDGRNQAAQFRGEAPGPRTWVFHQLARNWYVREAGWKLNQAGELFDMSDAPFVEQLVPAGSETPAALAARRRLAAALAELNPAGGIPDTGDESGRHAKNVEERKKKGRNQ